MPEKNNKRKMDNDTVLVYFGLEDEKRQELEAFARECGVSFDELVSQGVELLLKQLRACLVSNCVNQRKNASFFAGVLLP